MEEPGDSESSSSPHGPESMKSPKFPTLAAGHQIPGDKVEASNQINYQTPKEIAKEKHGDSGGFKQRW